MGDPKPTPFELASLAALLAIRDKNSSVSSPVNYIPDAMRLWKAAALHLTQPDEIAQHNRDMKILGYERFSFDQALTPSAPLADGRKKPRTMVGNITTEEGLTKAIRRIWKDPEEANDIIKQRSLNQLQIHAILSDQKRRNSTRTQAATKARKKSVK